MFSVTTNRLKVFLKANRPAISKIIAVICVFASTAPAQIAGQRLGLASHPSTPPSSQSDPIAQLGASLFFDSRLSTTGLVSCATCHQPDRAFAGGERTSAGVQGAVGARNAPGLLNLAVQTRFFWDGRQSDLATAIAEPLINPMEHGFSSAVDLLAAVHRDPAFATQVANAWEIPPENLAPTHLTQALAAYLNALPYGESPFDRHVARRGELSDAAARGYRLFVGAAQCSSCHSPGASRPRFTDDSFHAIGIGSRQYKDRVGVLAQQVLALRASGQTVARIVTSNAEHSALGRFVVTLDPADIGKFRTPSLRNVAITAPYMHDGSMASLAEVVDHEIYYMGVRTGRTPSLSPQDRDDIVEFLQALTEDRPAAAAR
jgi:cytochrome c peroxidase